MRVSEKTKRETRGRIVESAVALFKAKGYADATTRDISEAAGIATGTLFNYFPSKEAIVMSLIVVGWRASLARVAEGPDELEPSLFDLGAGCLRALKTHRSYLFPAFEALAGPRHRASEPDVVRLREDHLTRVEDLLVRSGLARFMSGLSLHLYWTLLMGVFSFWVEDRSPHQEDSLALLDVSTKLFLGSLNEGKR